MRTLIRGGDVVTADGLARADVLVEDGTIQSVGAQLATDADRIIDARHRYVMPGGVDPHTHIDSVFRGMRTSDDFASGTRAAAAGGTTTIIDFCFPRPDQRLADAVDDWHERFARGAPLVDAGAHLVLVQPDEERLAELPEAVDRGIASLKLYTAYPGRTMSDDAAVFRTLQAAAALGLTVLVHAESGAVIEVLISQSLAGGHVEPIWHARTRPPTTESEAVARTIALAEMVSARLYLVHLTCEESLAAVAAGRARHPHVWAETCPQYLLLDERVLEQAPPIAAGFVCTPPLRPAGHQLALWRGLADRTLDTVGSDHCPFDLSGQKIVGDDFTRILNGVPGVEQRMVLLHHFGVRAGRITLPRLVELTATTPASIFGLPHKGRIAPGCDADLVIFDPQRELRISAATHHSHVDYLPYEGLEVIGAPDRVLLRGQEVVVEGEPVDAMAGVGRFLARETASVSGAYADARRVS